jgi:hypothetical protein
MSPATFVCVCVCVCVSECVCLKRRKNINLEICGDLIPWTQLFIDVCCYLLLLLLLLFRNMFRLTLSSSVLCHN